MKKEQICPFFWVETIKLSLVFSKAFDYERRYLQDKVLDLVGPIFYVTEKKKNSIQGKFHV